MAGAVVALAGGALSVEILASVYKTELCSSFAATGYCSYECV